MVLFWAVANRKDNLGIRVGLKQFLIEIDAGSICDRLDRFEKVVLTR